MPQELHVVCCYLCKMFQVDIVKKSKKWICKICNEKQSLQKVYFQGIGKDCRAYVQKMNTLTHDQSEMLTHNKKNTDTTLGYREEYQPDSQSNKVQSKWTKYLDSNETSAEPDATNNCNQTTFESCEHSDISDSVIEATVFNEYRSENSYGGSRNTQDVSMKSNETYNISIDCHDKLTVLHEYNTTNVDIEKDNVKKTIKSKNIFDNNDDFDVTLDF